jgi:hypothetical protein
MLYRKGKPDYSALARYLSGQTDNTVALSFDELEKIIGAPLPNSARLYTMWWNPSGHSHAQKWEQSGYKAVNVGTNIHIGRMQFARKAESLDDMAQERHASQPNVKEDIMPYQPDSKSVVLISCSKLKRKYPCEARLLYDESALFKKSLAYAQTVSEEIYVLSSKHGLVALDKIIEPYEETLNDKPSAELAVWGDRVAEQLARRFDTYNTEFIILAGKNYYTPLRAHLPRMKLPLIGLPLGERMAKLDELIRSGNQEHSGNGICYRLHRLFNIMPRYKWDTINGIGFDNGIYILFEAGESYFGMDRIVRVGTHRSDGRLRQRLKDHFVKENKDGSIFRKNIGKAILNKNNHPYLAVWAVDTSKEDNIRRLGKVYNAEFQKKVEDRVTDYMRGHFSFVCFPVDTERERLRLEEGIIATLNKDNSFTPSSDWRGQFSTEYEIKTSGLWLKQGLDGVPVTEPEYIRIENLCKSSIHSPAI